MGAQALRNETRILKETNVLVFGGITLIPERLTREDGDKKVEELGLERADLKDLGAEQRKNPELHEVLKREWVQVSEIGLPSSGYRRIEEDGTRVPIEEDEHRSLSNEKGGYDWKGTKPVLAAVYYYFWDWNGLYAYADFRDDGRAWVACKTKASQASGAAHIAPYTQYGMLRKGQVLIIGELRIDAQRDTPFRVE